jgi:cytochrome c-type biogenesis protein CcmH/NrfG
MAPTTVTTIVLVLFALGLLALTAYAWFGSWDAAVRGRGAPASRQDEIEVAVLAMRRSIEDYERRQRS